MTGAVMAKKTSGDEWLSDPAARRRRRIKAALAMGFGLIFGFALVLQLTADFVAWLTSTRVTFLFPLGLTGALTNLSHFISVILGLAMTALAVSGFLYWRMRMIEERPSLSHYLSGRDGGRDDGSRDDER